MVMYLLCKFLRYSLGFSICTFVGLRIFEEIKYRQIKQKYKKYFAKNIYVDLEVFSHYNAECRKHMVKGYSCERKFCSYHKLYHLINMLDNAKTSIDLCMYLVTCKDLVQAIERARNRKVFVRVIVEKDMAGSSSSKAKWLMQNGVNVRCRALSTLMHHKFCIIDGKKDNGILLTGSLNWTLQALAGNWEFILVSNHPYLLEEFTVEFDTLWDFYKPME